MLKKRFFGEKFISRVEDPLNFDFVFSSFLYYQSTLV